MCGRSGGAVIGGGLPRTLLDRRGVQRALSVDDIWPNAGGGLSVCFGCLASAIRWPFVTTVRTLQDLQQALASDCELARDPRDSKAVWASLPAAGDRTCGFHQTAFHAIRVPFALRRNHRGASSVLRGSRRDRWT